MVNDWSFITLTPGVDVGVGGGDIDDVEVDGEGAFATVWCLTTKGSFSPAASAANILAWRRRWPSKAIWPQGYKTFFLRH